jgi:3',5'-cyclic AMP phosphodiesterase CpdA
MKRTFAASLLVVWLAGGWLAAAGAGTDTSFRFVVLSDRTGGHTPGVYADVIDEINLLNPDFVVTVGDHIEGYGEDYDHSLAEWDSLLVLTGRLEAPIHMIPGNHDIWDDESERIYGEKTGTAPYYSFDYGNTHFVVLDVSRIEQSADLPEEQREWLVSDLAAHEEAENIFVFYHKPLWVGTLMVGRPDPMHEIFVQYGVDAVWNGHLHHYFAAEFDGVDYTVMGSSGGYIYRVQEQPVARGEFFQFGWVTVEGSGYELAVVDLGSIYPRSVVTTDDLAEIERVENNLVRMGEIHAVDDTSLRAPVDVTVANVTDEPLDQMMTWDIPDGWMVEPGEALLAVDPGDTGTVTFMMMNSGALYPTPSLSCRYPLSNGRNLDIDVPARVVRTARSKMVSAPPVVDGVPDDACWEDCKRVRSLHPPYDAVVDGDTEFAFACDGENLYLSAVCRDPQMVDLSAEIEERDGSVFGEDCVGYFFQPDPSDLTVYQIYVNAIGTVFDQRITFDENMWYTADRTWDGEYEVATQRTDDRWSVEVKIPLSSIGADVGANPVWRTNFRRKQARTGASGDWQIPIEYNPATFGELVFD